MNDNAVSQAWSDFQKTEAYQYYTEQYPDFIRRAKHAGEFTQKNLIWFMTFDYAVKTVEVEERRQNMRAV